MKAVFLVFALAVGAHAQTAKVISISSEDAEKAASLHRLLHDTENNIKDFDAQIRAKYLRNPDDKTNHSPQPLVCQGSTCIAGDPSWASQYGFKEGWGMGEFEYSEDYKFIVPAHETKATGNVVPWGCTQYVVPDNYRPSISPGVIGSDHYFQSGPLDGVIINYDGTVQSR